MNKVSIKGIANTAVIERKIRRGLEIWRLDGWFGVLNQIQYLYAKNREKTAYQKWIKQQTLTEAARRKIREEIKNLQFKPLISVVMPVYNVEEKWLRLCIESVRRQIYANWELCVADDCSPSAHIRKVLEEYAAKDDRIKVFFREQNGHISAASNSALELASGEFAALLDHDDELTEDALFHVVKEINDFPATAFLYSDEDMIDERGRRYAPKFKPDFSFDFLYSLNLITHLSVYRTDVLRAVGGFRLGAEGSQDYDLALRVAEEIGGERIRHIPRILYHWRAIKGSVAFAADEKPYAHERAREAIGQHLERTGKKASVAPTVYNFHRVHYLLPENAPRVSVIIAGAGDDARKARQAINNFAEKTNYRSFEIILGGSENLKKALENESFPVATKIIAFNEQSKAAARLNFAAAAASDGEILCFVDADLLPTDKDWLTELASFAAQAEIGAVGAKILTADERIEHAGLLIGGDTSVEAAHRGWSARDDGYLARLRLINNYAAVSASCLAVRRDVFSANEGFDADNFPKNLFDADFCLRLGAKKYRVVFTPYAELMRIGGKKRGARKKASEKEIEAFRRKWSGVIGKDPFYNPNLAYKNGSFSIKI